MQSRTAVPTAPAQTFSDNVCVAYGDHEVSVDRRRSHRADVRRRRTRSPGSRLCHRQGPVGPLAAACEHGLPRRCGMRVIILSGLCMYAHLGLATAVQYSCTVVSTGTNCRCEHVCFCVNNTLSQNARTVITNTEMMYVIKLYPGANAYSIGVVITRRYSVYSSAILACVSRDTPCLKGLTASATRRVC